MRMLRLLCALLIPFVLVALASEARADPKKDPFDFGPRPGQPSQPGRVPRPEEAKPPAAPDDPITRDIRDLAQWPDKTGIHAAESLLLRGEVVIPRLVDVLSAEANPSQPGAAWVLGRLGESAHVAAILRAAAQRRNGARAEVFFEAAWDLDAKRTKDWLFSFLTLDRLVFRQKATDFLVEYVEPADRVRVLRLLDSRKAGVRIAGLRLLAGAGIEDAEQRLVEALGDPVPSVARAASVLLASKRDEETKAGLNEVALEGLPRERAYATLALVEIARADGRSPFQPRTLSEMAGRRGLLHPDKLPRGAAAVGLAYGALESKDPSLAALLDRAVIDVLIDTVGGEHFLDLSSLAEPVFSALRRLSGQDLPTTAVAWATWWQGERGHFQARRPLIQVKTKDLPFAFVRFDVVESDGRRRRIGFRSEDGTPTPGEYALSRDAFQALIKGLELRGIFDADGADEARADEHLTITLGVENQKRRMTVPATDDRYALMRMQLDELEEANLWQHYRDTDRWPNAAEWWAVTSKQMADADPETRVVLLRAAIVHAFDDLPTDADRSGALDRLEDLRRQDAEAGALSAADVATLVSAATSAVSFGEVEERAVGYALEQDAAREVRPDLIEALAVRTEPSAAALLSELLASGGAEQVRDAFADPRPGLRAAAARASKVLLEAGRYLEPDAKKHLEDRLRPGLEVIARDDEPLVAIQAIVALDRMGTAGGVERLETIYRSGDAAVKAAVAEALGEMPPDEAWPFFSLILAEERDPTSGLVRSAALRAMGKSGHTQSTGLLVFYLLNDPNRSVRVAAADALADSGTDEARYAVIRALTEGNASAEQRARLVDVLGRFRGPKVADVLLGYLEDQDPTVSRVAALRLADHNAAASVPYLIEILRGKSPAMASAAHRALENVSCVVFDTTGHEMLAGQYESWYGQARITSAGEPDRAWFRAALRKRGYDVGVLLPYVAGEDDLRAVPLLIRALRDDEAVIRRGAAIALERLTGLSMGKVERTTSLHDAIKVADEWARWWKRVQGPADGDR